MSAIKNRTWRAPVCVVLFALSISGCSEFPSPKLSMTSFLGGKAPKSNEETAKAPKKERDPSRPTVVLVDSTALALNQPERDIAQRKVFLERFNALIKEKRIAAARVHVQRHPDVAAEILRDAFDTSDASLITLAQFHDEHLGMTGAHSWQALYAEYRNHPQKSATYREQRSRFMGLLRNGQFAEAEKLSLVATAQSCGSKLLLLDACYQTGISRLLTQKPAEAAEMFANAVTAAQGCSPLQAVYAGLLLAESQRRAGNSPAANGTWCETVHAGAELLGLQNPVPDPTFWDRASYLQPVGIDWPGAVDYRLRQVVQRPSTVARTPVLQQVAIHTKEGQAGTTTLVWTGIGSWLNERGEAQGALVALKRAESTASGEAAAWLTIAESRTLARLDQSGAASALLMQVVSQHRESSVAKAALADLGTLRVRAGSLQQGVSLLKQSMDTNPQMDWPGRASSEADLGLALLMVGEESGGLRYLESAKRRFRSEGEVELLAKSLWNEAQYFEHAKNSERANKAQEELKSLQL